MKETHKNSFEFINDKILNKIPKKDKNRLFKYRRVRRDIVKFENEIEELKNQLKEKRQKLNRYNEMLTHIYGQIEYLKSDYDFKISIICDRKKFGIYWNTNVKYKRNLTKSIYLGSDKKIRKLICDRNNVDVTISDEEFKDLLYYEFSDSIKDWCIENKNDIMNRSVKMEDLLV